MGRVNNPTLALDTTLLSLKCRQFAVIFHKIFAIIFRVYSIYTALGIFFQTAL